MGEDCCQLSLGHNHQYLLLYISKVAHFDEIPRELVNVERWNRKEAGKQEAEGKESMEITRIPCSRWSYVGKGISLESGPHPRIYDFGWDAEVENLS
jgi:hypothetical protein